MGWSIGWDHNWKRDIGYGVPAYCDHPGCDERIDRGLSYVCGGEPYGGDTGCGLYFCDKHLYYRVTIEGQCCWRCKYGKRPFKPKPEHPEWLEFKETDPSWAQWRKEQNSQRELP